MKVWCAISEPNGKSVTDHCVKFNFRLSNNFQKKLLQYDVIRIKLMLTDLIGESGNCGLFLVQFTLLSIQFNIIVMMSQEQYINVM